MTRQLVRCVVAAGLVLAGRPDSAWAQSSPPYPVVAGSRIRIDAPTTLARWFEGTVKEIDEQTLLIETANHSAVRVQRQAITSLDVSIGRRRQFAKGAKIGAGIGMVVAVLGAKALGLASSEMGPAVANGLIGGVMYGAGIGALIKRDHWIAVPMAPVPVSSTAAHGRRVLTLASVRF